MTEETQFPEHLLVRSSGQFTPKLTEEQRCSIYALTQKGVKRDVIALAFGVDGRTVAHIANRHSPKYKSVRVTYDNLGHDAFMVRYLTEDAVRMVVAAAPEPAPMRANPGASSDLGVSKRANRMAGTHVIPAADGLRKGNRSVEIMYRSDIDGMPDGWYYRDITSGDNNWYHHGDASLKTSVACYNAVIENLTD